MPALFAPVRLCNAAGERPAAIFLFIVIVWSATSLPADPVRDPAAEPIIILIGGNHSDPSPEQLAGTARRGGNSGLWRMKQDLHAQNGLTAEYFNWNGTRGGHIDEPRPGGAVRIAERIRKLRAQQPDADIILVGNSWGGHTAWQVCHLLAGGTIQETLGTQQSINNGAPQSQRAAVPDTTSQPAGEATTASQTAPPHAGVIEVRLLVLVDASSFGRGTEPMPRELPDNVKQAVNFHTRNAFGWCGWIEDDRLESIDLGDPQQGYLVAGGPRYDSTLSWTAHVAAEWDERIHAVIREWIGNVIAP